MIDSSILFLPIIAGALASLIALVLRGSIRKYVLFMLTSRSNSEIEAFIRNYETPAPKQYEL